MGDGVYLLITVKEFPRFDKLVIEGNDGVDTDDIKKAVTLVRGQVLSPHELKKIQRDIKKLYEKEGYLLARWTCPPEPPIPPRCARPCISHRG